MIDLLKRDFPDLSLLEKLRSLTSPPVFLAENLTDFLDNKDDIEVSFLRRRGILDRSNDFAGIIVPDVSIVRLGYVPQNLIEVAYSPPFNVYASIVPADTHYFALSDGSSEMRVLWTPKDSLLHSPPQTYEQAREEFGLLPEDSVSVIRFKYYPNRKYSTVVSIEKDNSSEVEELLRSLTPDLLSV